MIENRSGHDFQTSTSPSSPVKKRPFARLLLLSFTLAAILMPSLALSRSSALSLTRSSFDARWEQLQAAAREVSESEEMTEEDASDEAATPAADPTDAQLNEAAPAPTTAINVAQLEDLSIEGEIQKHTLELPEVQTPWVVHITNFFLADSADGLPQVEIELIPSGEGSVQIEAPEDFLIESGSVTVDPFSQPPVVKVSGVPGKRIHTDEFKLKLRLPANEVSVEGALDLKLSSGNLSELDLNLTGAIELTASDLQVDELLLRSANDGNVVLAGSAGFASLDLTSGTCIDARSLESSAQNVRFDNTVSGSLGRSERAILEGPESAAVTPPDGEWVRLSSN